MRLRVRTWGGNAPRHHRDGTATLADSDRVFVILPAASSYVPHEDAERLRSRIGEGAVVELPRTGHAIHRDDTNRFVGVILRYLHGGPPASVTTTAAGADQ